MAINCSDIESHSRQCNSENSISYQFIRMFLRMSNVWHKRSSKIEFDAHRIPFSKAMYQMYWLNTDQRVSGESSSRTEFSVHKIPWTMIKFLDQNPIRISLSAKDSQWSIPDWCYSGTKYYSLICRNWIPFQSIPFALPGIGGNLLHKIPNVGWWCWKSWSKTFQPQGCWTSSDFPWMHVIKCLHT